MIRFMKKAWMVGILLSGCLILDGCSKENVDAGNLQEYENSDESAAQEYGIGEEGTAWEYENGDESTTQGHENDDESIAQEYEYGEMTEDFYLVIEDTFGLIDRNDVVIVGINRNSPLYVNAKVDVITEEGRVETSVGGIEIFTEQVDGVEAETTVGVMLTGIMKEDIQAGDIIVLRGCENPVEKMNQEAAKLMSTILSTEYPEEKAYIPAYVEVIQQYEEEYDGVGYDLIYLDEDEVPELVVGKYGYWVSVFTYAEGEIHTPMDMWGYGAMGNMGYEYIPKENVMRNYNNDRAGAILYTTYFGIDDKQEIEIFVSLEMSCLDEDGNIPHSDEEFQNARWHFYVDEQEITEEDYLARGIDGDYEFMIGTKTILEVLQGLVAWD